MGTTTITTTLLHAIHTFTFTSRFTIFNMYLFYAVATVVFIITVIFITTGVHCLHLKIHKAVCSYSMTLVCWVFRNTSEIKVLKFSFN